MTLADGYFVAFVADAYPTNIERTTRVLAHARGTGSLSRQAVEIADFNVPDLFERELPLALHSEFWCLHGRPYRDSLIQVPQFSLYDETSLSTIDLFFSQLAARFEWTIFPWGKELQSGMLALVTKNSEIRDAFLSPSGDPIEQALALPASGIYADGALRQKLPLNVASYKVGRSFAEVFHGIIFWSENRARTIWNITQDRHTRPPLLLHVESSLADAVAGLTSDQYKALPTRFVGSSEKRNLILVQALNIGAFLRLAEHNNTVFAVSGDCDPNALRRTLTDVASFFNDFLAYVPGLLEHSGWSYCPGLGLASSLVDVFVSRDVRVARSLLDNQTKGFRLYSCF